MKKLRAFLCTILVGAVLTTTTFAALTTIDIWGGNNGTNVYSWSPTITTVRADNTGGKFRVVSYFKWNSSNVNTVFDLPSDLYYTMEHFNLDDNGNATEDDIYTNIPYAVFDVEDDRELFAGRNGYEEELEVSCYSVGDPEPFMANANYFVDTTWHNYDAASKVMACAIRSQRSMRAAGGEMQAHATEYHGQTGDYAVSAGSRTTNAIVNEECLNAEEIAPQVIALNPESRNAAMSQMRAQKATMADITDDRAKEILENANVVVTFSAPLSNAEVVDLLEEVGAKVSKYTLKYEMADGTRITGWTKDISSSHLQEKYNYLSAEHDGVSYEGVVCADIVMDATDEVSYNALVNSQLVYLADFSDPITRIEEGDYDNQLEIVVMDASWTLEQ